MRAQPHAAAKKRGSDDAMSLFVEDRAPRSPQPSMNAASGRLVVSAGPSRGATRAETD
jgi:hypothetical protein